MPIILVERNQELKGKRYEIPDKLQTHLNQTYAKFEDKKQYHQSKGFKRLKGLADQTAPSKTNKKNPNGKTVLTFKDLENIDYEFRHGNKNPNDLQRQLNGGDEMANFVRNTIQREQNKVKPILAKKKQETREKNKIKPSKSATLPTKLEDLGIHLSEETKPKTIYFTENQIKNALLNEYVDKDLFALKKYIENGSDENSDKDIVYNYPQYFEDFYNVCYGEEYDESFDNWVFDTADEYFKLVENDDYEGMAQWIFDNVEESMIKRYITYIEMNVLHGEVNTNRIMTDPKIVQNKWMIHFTDSAYNIQNGGFTRGVDDFDDLGYSRRGSGYGGMYNFAYLVDDFEDYYKGRYNRPKYGNEAVIFKASGVRAWHYGDEEWQVIFNGRTARNLVYVENYDGEWFVVGKRKGEAIYKSNDLEDVVYWVANNYDQYHKQITSFTKQKKLGQGVYK